MVNKFAEETVKLNRSSINHVSFYIFVTLRYLCLACYLLIIFSVRSLSILKNVLLIFIVIANTSGQENLPPVDSKVTSK